jgi:predicted O-methyltransferase YrrM
VKSILNFLKTVVFIVVEAGFRPRWAYYRFKGLLYSHFLNRFHQKHIEEYQKASQPLEDALAFITGKSREEVIEAGRSEILDKMQIRDRWVVDLPHEDDHETKKGPIEVRYGPSPEFMKCVHIICRLMQPDVMIETGVGKGFISASALDALEQNGKGKLYSVELPSLYRGYRKQIGEQIPRRLRHRWRLDFGPSAVVLPKLIDELGSVDVFVCDSGSGYDNQIMEFSTILAAMPAGGVLISALLKTDAVIDLAEMFDFEWTSTGQTKPYPVGLICKLS